MEISNDKNNVKFAKCNHSVDMYLAGGHEKITDYGELMRAIAREVRHSPLSVDFLAEGAGITNRFGEPSPYRLYNFWSARSFPMPWEWRRMIQYFVSTGLKKCVYLIHNYFFGSVGDLLLHSDTLQTDGSFDDDLHSLTARLGDCAQRYLDACADKKIMPNEAREIVACLDELIQQAQTAKKEINSIAKKEENL